MNRYVESLLIVVGTRVTFKVHCLLPSLRHPYFSKKEGELWH